MMARTRAQDYDAKRAAILHKAAELFAKHGFSGTSITMIAEACEVSKALLYHYYHDKEQVLFDLLFAHLEDLVAAVESAAAEHAVPKQRLYRLAEALLEAYRDADTEHQVQITNLKQLSPEKQEVLLAMERKLVRIFSDTIAQTIPEIGRGPLLKPMTMSLFGMLNWQYLWFREGRGLTRTQYARLVIDLMISGAATAAKSVGAPTETSRKTARRAVKAG
jgi:AcrR family transcriptional regulator